MDETSDLQRMSENQVELSITKYEQSVTSPMKETNQSFEEDPYKK